MNSKYRFSRIHGQHPRAWGFQRQALEIAVKRDWIKYRNSGFCSGDFWAIHDAG